MMDMQEDKKMKELLMKFAADNPPADFTGKVMQRVNLVHTYQTQSKPLLNQSILQVLLGVFVIICVVLLALSFTMPATTLALQLDVKLPARYFTQGIQFLMVFWVVVLFNVVVKKHAVASR